VVECADDAQRDQVEAVVARYLVDFVARWRRGDGRVHGRVRRRSQDPLLRDVYRLLVERGWVLELGRGQVGLAGPARALADGLDRAWLALASSTFDAVEHVYPTFIPSEALRRCGYFSSFPHMVSLVTHFVEGYERLDQIRRANTDSDELVIPADAVAFPEACVAPAVCYHCYQALEGRVVPAPGQTFTAIGRCARYESTNMVGLDRLWDFSMREIVFVGAESWVDERRARAMEAVVEMLQRWDLECSIETANDPFFAPIYATKSFWQARGALKYEARLAVEPSPAGDARTVAAASFNIHERFFGETFSIRTDDGAPACTGCVAFGVERWVLAVFSQHGLESARWPASLRALLR
jgi:seryl-tRNA synthetase